MGFLMMFNVPSEVLLDKNQGPSMDLLECLRNVSQGYGILASKGYFHFFFFSHSLGRTYFQINVFIQQIFNLGGGQSVHFGKPRLRMLLFGGIWTLLKSINYICLISFPYRETLVKCHQIQLLLH